MAENTDIPGLDGLVSTITGEPSGPSLAASTASFIGGGNRPPSSGDTGSIFSSILSTLTGSGGGSSSSVASSFLGGGSSSPSSASSGSLFSTLGDLVFGNRRSSNPQGPLRPVNRRPPLRRPIRQHQQHRPGLRRQSVGGFRPSRRIRNKRQTMLQGNLIRQVHSI